MVMIMSTTIHLMHQKLKCKVNEDIYIIIYNNTIIFIICNIGETQ